MSAHAPFITKGDKIHVEIFISENFGDFSLSGVMMKLTGQMVMVAGTCVHFRGNHPTNPTDTRIYIDVDGTLPKGLCLTKPFGCTHEQGHLEVQEGWIRIIEKDGKIYRLRPNGSWL